MKVSITWSTRREGNWGFVLEEHFDRFGARVDKLEFKVPANVIPAFVEGRRRVIGIVADQYGAVPEEIDPHLDALLDGLAKEVVKGA